MARHYTAVGAPLLMASAVLLMGTAAWNAASRAPSHPSPARIIATPVAPAAPAPMAELPPLPALQPMPALQDVAINIAIPTARQPTPPKPSAARAAPRKAPTPVPVAAQPSPPAAPPHVRVAEAGSRA